MLESIRPMGLAPVLRAPLESLAMWVQIFLKIVKFALWVHFALTVLKLYVQLEHSAQWIMHQRVHCALQENIMDCWG
jgi:hypothetical protein